MAGKPFQVVVWGATGFTGRLVCEHIARDYQGKVSFAMAGRSQAKLEAVRAELAAQYGAAVADTPILVGSLDDAPSLDAIARQTSVIISTAGPFAKHGTPVIEAAVRNGSHYVDITGEIPWVKRMVTAFHEEAAAKGVRVVNCCGYDSVPSDLGALLVIDAFKAAFGGALPRRVVSAVVKASGGVSGGTVASGMNLFEDEKAKRRGGGGGDAADTMGTYALIPEGQPRGRDGDLWGIEWCGPLQRWLGPFVMQACNTRIVQRSNYLLGWGGPEFSYREGMAAGGRLGAAAIALGTAAVGLALSQTWLHPLMRKFVPAPGEGPSREAMMEKGFYRHAVAAEGPQGTVVAEVGDPGRDPGYWGTSRMVLEAALCLALQQRELDADAALVHGGVVTPAAALGRHLIERLRAAGLTWEVKETRPAGAA